MAQTVTRQRAIIAAIVGAFIGLPAGIGMYTFIYARGISYMTDDPTACANCHVMQEHYNGWMKGSHRSVAVCNDCHTPPGFFAKYMVKGINGYHHSMAFTTQRFHEPIQIKKMNFDVTEKTCRKCHAQVTMAIEGPEGQIGSTSCIKCHSSVGHLE